MSTNITALTVGTQANAKLQHRQFESVFDVITATVVLTQASIAAQVASQATVNIPGVLLGDLVVVNPVGDITGLMAFGNVSSNDNVKIIVWNVEGTDANTTLSAGFTFNVWVLRPKVFAQN
jgi:hypothetical protein